MDRLEGRSYYLSPEGEILDLYQTHSRAWHPFLARRYGDASAQAVIEEARETLEDMIPELPYIGGDDNPMTRHIIRCSTSLALYKAIEGQGEVSGGNGPDPLRRRNGELPPHAPHPAPTEGVLARWREETGYPGSVAIPVTESGPSSRETERPSTAASTSASAARGSSTAPTERMRFRPSSATSSS